MPTWSKRLTCDMSYIFLNSGATVRSSLVGALRRRRVGVFAMEDEPFGWPWISLGRLLLDQPLDHLLRLLARAQRQSFDDEFVEQLDGLTGGPDLDPAERRRVYGSLKSL